MSLHQPDSFVTIDEQPAAVPSIQRLFLRVDEAALAIGISRRTAYELIAAGKLPSVRIGNVLRVPVAQLRVWAEQLVATQATERATKNAAAAEHIQRLRAIKSVRHADRRANVTRMDGLS